MTEIQRIKAERDFFQSAIVDLMESGSGLNFTYVRSRLGALPLDEWCRQTIAMAEMIEDVPQMIQAIQGGK
jgi:hypothetical protein